MNKDGVEFDIVGMSEPFLELERQIRLVAIDPKSPVLITGGRGKAGTQATRKLKFLVMRLRQAWMGCLSTIVFASLLTLLFAERTSSTFAPESQSAIVILQDRSELSSLIGSLKTNQMTRQARHQHVVRAYQEVRSQSQADLVKYLKAQKSLGRITDYQQFWIINAIVVTASDQVLKEIAQRYDVVSVYKEQEIGPIQKVEPIELKNCSAQGEGSERGLRAINAHRLWAKGINGAGTLVCSLEGVNGNHPALYSRWRGNNGASAHESWFDPYDNSHFPVDISWNTHGTFTMGIMTGMTEKDTVGVAFGAQWISACGAEAGMYEASLRKFLASFQWVADPDGDPVTIEDVPDVVNISFRFGRSLQCRDFFWDVIDAVEAAGVVSIFSAGNDGKLGAFTIGNPASRATTPINTFAVGAVDGDSRIADFSSRGPSSCDGVSVKPEVVAPGVKIRSLSGDGYGLGTGTSFSAPHVSGAVALLRQINPDATVEDIKYALLRSAVDLGPKGEDNGYGMGIIDVDAASRLLPPCIKPNINLSRFTLDDANTHFLEKNRDIEMVAYLVNTGVSAQHVMTRLLTSDPHCHLSVASSDFGTMDQDQMTSNENSPFMLRVDESTPDGQNIVFDLEILANGGEYKTVSHFSGIVTRRAPRLSVEPSFVEIDLDIGARAWSPISVANLGSNNLEYTINEVSPTETSVNQKISRASANNRLTWRSSSLSSKTHLSCFSVTRDSVGDTPSTCGFDIAEVSISIVDTTMTFCLYTDSSEQIITDTFHALLIRTVLTKESTLRRSSFSLFLDTDQNALTGLYPPSIVGIPSSKTAMLAVGAEFVISGPSDTYCPGTDGNKSLVTKYASDGGRDENYGVVIPLRIDSESISVAIPLVLRNDTDVNMHLAVAGYHIILDTTGAAAQDVCLDLVPNVGHGLIGMDTTPIPWLTEVPQKGIVSPSGIIKDIYLVADAVHLDNLIYTNNIFISTNDPAQPVITISVKVTVGDSRRPVVPGQFRLYENYPNPFNSSTTIEYQLTGAGRVTIEVFNLLGQKVKTLIDAEKIIGYHQVVWDGKDDQNREATSGVYLCRLMTKEFVGIRKMVLIR